MISRSETLLRVGLGLAIFLLSLMLTSREAKAVGWLKLGGRYVALGGLEVKIPVSWRMARGLENQLVLTRDGISLQLFVIGMASIEEAFPHTKKKLSLGASPESIAEIAMDNLRSNPAIANFRLLESSTATLAGFRAPRLVYAFEGDYGVKKMALYSALLLDHRYFFFQYQAPERHYFRRGQASVDDTLSSLIVTY